MTPDLRLCGHCGKQKPPAEFGTSSPYCRACVSEYHRMRRAAIKRSDQIRAELQEIGGKHK